mgnify:CR=1 FL=1|jgi:serine/threonine protein kinase
MSSFTPTRSATHPTYDQRPPAYLTEKYEFGERLGGGAYGDVWLAHMRNTTPRKTVAVKHIKRQYNRWEDCLKLRECRALSKLPAHKNCVKLFQLIHEQHELFFVFEYCPMDLHILTMKRRSERSPFTNKEVLSLTYELLSALQHLHRHGFFHRDIKPENLLVSDISPGNTVGTVKLADFGQTREIRSRPPFTDYVSTRWYRAPEVLDGLGQYNSPVDIWAAGCVLGELMTCGHPIFPGQSVLQQLDMVHRARNPEVMGGDVDLWEPPNMQQVSTSAEMVVLMRALLSFDQRKRPNATAALRSTVFGEFRQKEEKEKEIQQAQQATAVKAAADGSGNGSCNTVPGKENVLSTPTRSKRVGQLLKDAGYESSLLSEITSSDGSSTAVTTPTTPTPPKSRTMRVNSEHILRQAFRKYDYQNTGYIDAKAVSRILVKLGDFSQDDESTTGEGEPAMSLMAAEAEVALADTSARGVLSYEDFKEWFTERAASGPIGDGSASSGNIGGGSNGAGGMEWSSSNDAPTDGRRSDAEKTSARVAAARQLLMQSWDSPPKSTSPHRKKTPSKLRQTSMLSSTNTSNDVTTTAATMHTATAAATTATTAAATVIAASSITEATKMTIQTAVPSSPSAPESPKRSLFNRFDAEKNGFLDKSQFGNMMVHLGMVTNPDTEDDVLVEAEMAMLADDHGKIPYQDWREWYASQ